MARDAYLDPYRQSVQRHGPQFEATLWASPRAQRLRFKVFTELCFMTGKRILDAGCSRGDFAQFLIERNIAFDQYIGVDGVREVIDHALAQNLPRCTFVCGDFLREPQLLATGDPQIICLSGTLNTMTDRQVFALLHAAWSAASQALLFNFLPDTAGPRAARQTRPARRLDTIRILRWAFEQTSQVLYRQDYFKHGHDATVMMRKTVQR